MWISCTLETSSHTLSSEAFSVLQNSQANTRIRVLSETQMLISVRHPGPETDSSLERLHHAHQVIRTFLISFNVASIGYFYWTNAPWIHPVLSTTSDLDGADRSDDALIAKPEHNFEHKDPLTKLAVQNAILIFGIFAKESSVALDTEYTKGILLLRMQFCDINFRTEAFMCFYRALEFFVTSRLLKVKKLTNELKDIQRGLATVGLDGDVLDEFKQIYVIRSSLAAHTQIQPRSLTFDEVMKAKVFLDFVIHKTFVEQGTLLMQTRHDA